MKNPQDSSRFYTYMYFDPITNVPFYIWKGAGTRWMSQLVGSVGT